MPKVTKFEGHYYVWENGTKTHISFIQKAIRGSDPLPAGFYNAAKKSKDPGIKKLLQVAQDRNIPELTKEA